MPRLSKVFLPLIGSSVAGCFVRFLGSDRSTTPELILLFFLLLLSLTLVSRSTKRKRSVILLFLIFFISFFFYFLRIYLLSRLDVLLADLFSFVLVLSVGGGQGLPLPGPSNSSSEDLFGLQVLSEPWPPTHNIALESSMINRILAMENTNSIFLMDKDRGVYWAEVKHSLNNCSSQKEYNQLIEFENRDLRIREKKHSCYSLFQQILTSHPALAENAAYTPQEAFCDFLDEKRSELDQQGGNVLVKDQREL